MIRLNLLPHRDARRRERRRAFNLLLGLAVATGVLMVIGVAGLFSARLTDQTHRNAVIRNENARLDVEIREIVGLRQDLEVLKARQQAVEDLQSDRNQPVYLLDELVRQVPEGVYLRSLRQTGQKVVLSGLAHSNDRVSELLRNLGSASPWLERPELVEVKAMALGPKDVRRAFEFTVNVNVLRPRDKRAADGGKSMSMTSAGTIAPVRASIPGPTP